MVLRGVVFGYIFIGVFTFTWGIGGIGGIVSICTSFVNGFSGFRGGFISVVSSVEFFYRAELVFFFSFDLT